jgi:hypothetical protein
MTNPEVIYVFEDQETKSSDADVDVGQKLLTDIVLSRY